MNRMVHLFLVLLIAPLIQSERHLFTDTGIASAHWSPTGNHILYVQEHGPRWELFRIDAGGGNELQLTEGALTESARWSPDGRQIAYTRIEIEYSGNDTVYRKILRVMNADGSQDHTVLERTDDFYLNCEWSPDGSKLLVWSDRELFTIAPDGSNVIPLVSGDAVGSSYVWSPDGQQIAFIGRDGTSIWVMNADSSEARRLISRLNLGGPVWTPDSKSITFAYNDEVPLSAVGVTIGIVNVSDRSFRDIVFKQTGYNAGFSWLPDGTKLVYSDYEDIYSINADGSGDTNLTNSQLQESFPIFSPDGSKIAMVVSSQVGPVVYVMDASGANSTRVSVSDYDVFNIAWSPTGAHLLFVGNQQPSTSLHVISAEGGVPTLLLEEVDSFAIAPDARKIAYMQGDLYDLYAMNLDGSAKTRLTENEYVTMYAWSPDGKRLALYVDQKGLYVVTADATTITELDRITTLEIPGPMQWSPDSSQLAFGYKGDIYVADTISVTDTITGSVTQLTTEGTYMNPQWSPTERKLVFFRVNELSVELFVYEADGAGLVKLLNLWGETPGLLQWSPDGNKILYSTSSMEPFAATNERASPNAPLPPPPVYSMAYVINADGSDRAFVDSTGYVIKWTQDGRWLLIGTTLLVSPDGLEKVELGPGSPILGQWSPDNTHVLYLISNGPGLYASTSIYVARLNLLPPTNP